MGWLFIKSKKTHPGSSWFGKVSDPSSLMHALPLSFSLSSSFSSLFNPTVFTCPKEVILLLPYYCAYFSWVEILGMSTKWVSFLFNIDNYIIVPNYSILFSLQENYTSLRIAEKLAMVPWRWLYFPIPLSGLTVWLVLANEIWAEQKLNVHLPALLLFVLCHR